MKSQSQDPDSFPAITSKVAFFMHPGNSWALNPRLKPSARGIVKQSWNTQSNSQELHLGLVILTSFISLIVSSTSIDQSSFHNPFFPSWHIYPFYIKIYNLYHLVSQRNINLYQSRLTLSSIFFFFLSAMCLYFLSANLRKSSPRLWQTLNLETRFLGFF